MRFMVEFLDLFEILPHNGTKAMTYKRISSFSKQAKRAAFTLVELLAVVAMIIIFSAIILASNQNATQQAREATYRQQQKQLQSSLEAWIATRPSMAGALSDWNADTSANAVLSRASSMLAFNSRGAFFVDGGKIVSEASSKSGVAFSVTWGSSNTERLTQGPVVSMVSL